MEDPSFSSAFLKNLAFLSLRVPKLLINPFFVIGGSEITNDVPVSEVKRAMWVGRGCHWGATLFLLFAAMVFGGVAGNWFDARHADGGIGLRIFQLAIGAVVMGAAVSIPGSLFFGRNPIRWGMGMPMIVYAAGVLIALLAGHNGVTGLIYGAPLLIGLSIAAGVMGAFLVDGIFVRRSPAR
jgi:hypothetical protein